MDIKQKIVLSLVTASLAMFSTGCSEDSTTTVDAPTAWETTVITGVTNDCLSGSTISGTCGVDVRLTAANSPYTLAGNAVKVVNGSTFTIDAGVTIQGESQAFLVITKGSKLVANGTSASPVIFTGTSGVTASGQWGGLTILGNASTNEAESIRYEVDEADEQFAYGGDGTNNTESSGTLTYVQILNSGYAVAQDKEVNGLSLCGVGSGTTINNITVTNSGDDGIEIWGGFPNLSDVNITGAQDDGFDIDSGYQGTVTNLTVTQTEPGASLIEMTNGGDATKQRTNLTLNGATLTASAKQLKDGGIYFKDLDITGTFNNVTIDMSASPTANTGAALTNKEGVYDSPSFDNITVIKSPTVAVTSNLKDGTTSDAGTIILDAAFAAGTGNTSN